MYTHHTHKYFTVILFFFNQVENDPSEFGLFVVHNSGFKEPCKEDSYPLHQRLKLGPNEDIAKILIMEASECQDIEVSSEVSYHTCTCTCTGCFHDTVVILYINVSQVQDYIKFSLHELEIFCKKFGEEDSKEKEKIKEW